LSAKVNNIVRIEDKVKAAAFAAFLGESGYFGLKESECCEWNTAIPGDAAQ
jgi:hypothetical protein